MQNHSSYPALAFAVALCLPLAPAVAAERPADTIEARVQACTGCHGAQGRGVANTYFPRLAGKPGGYLFQQLQAFRDGRRQYVPMNHLLASLPDAYLQEMADYFAAQQAAFPAPAASEASGELLERGRSIVTGGLPAQKVPPCMSCHGPALQGRLPAIPGLLGLPASYISAQLGAWRYGVRTAKSPDCMQFIAATLGEQDVAAVAAWLSSLPASADARPLNASTQPLPMACGSQPHNKGTAP